jgi:hypothetical protein
MLHRQRLGRLAGRLSESLIPDAILHLMGMPPVGTGHCQRLGKYLTLTFGVGAYHLAGLQDISVVNLWKTEKNSSKYLVYMAKSCKFALKKVAKSCKTVSKNIAKSCNYA